MTQTEPAAIDTGSEPADRLTLEAGEDHGDHAEVHAHATPGQYVFIGVVLGVLTAIEIWLSYSDLNHTPQTLLLVGLMVLKFALVVMYFMHLRFEKPVFRRLFVTGLVLAVSVFCIVLLAEHADLNHSVKSPPSEQPAGGE